MAVNTTNSIGVYQFIRIDGALEGLRPDVERITRNGVDGVTYWNTGTRGRSFQVTSWADQATYAGGLVTMREYELLIAAGLQRLVVENIFFGNVKVEDVVQRERFAISNARGGLLASPAAMLIADWTLTLIS